MDKGFKKDIIKLRKEGLTYKEIKCKINCSISTISYHCRNAGLDDQNRFRKPTKKEVEDMQSFYNEVKSSLKVAKKFGWAKTTVLKYIQTDKSKLNEEEIKKNRSNSVISWRRRTKVKLVEYKGGKCECCGYNKCIAALEFHHLDPKEKDFTISGKSWSFEKLKNEAEKCILVCNRCHTEIHNGFINLDKQFHSSVDNISYKRK